MKDIIGYEGLYAITSCGKVWSHRRQKFLSQRFDKWGYPRVSLINDGKLKTWFIHRLVADAYIPNPEGKATINHLDEVKTHNYINNLEWATIRENNNYGTRSTRVAKSNMQPVLCVETGEIYESVKAAAAAVGVCSANISNVLNGKQKMSGGYHWVRVAKEEVAAND